MDPALGFGSVNQGCPGGSVAGGTTAFNALVPFTIRTPLEPNTAKLRFVNASCGWLGVVMDGISNDETVPFRTAERNTSNTGPPPLFAIITAVPDADSLKIVVLGHENPAPCRVTTNVLMSLVLNAIAGEKTAESVAPVKETTGGEIDKCRNCLHDVVNLYNELGRSSKPTKVEGLFWAPLTPAPGAA